MLRRIRDGLLDILFPSSCLSCGADTTATRAVLCQTCLDSIPVHSAFFCPLCLARVPDPRFRCHPAAFLAGAAVSYDEPSAKALVKALKYQGVRSAALPLGTLAARHLALAAPPGFLQNAVLVPVPLSASRRRVRGYNQAEEIARVVADELRLPLEPELLRRIRHTKPQTEIAGRDERLKNVAGSFAASEDARGHTVLVIDDVYTTGATMGEAVRTLKAAGARRVYGITAARA